MRKNIIKIIVIVLIISIALFFSTFCCRSSEFVDEKIIEEPGSDEEIAGGKEKDIESGKTREVAGEKENDDWKEEELQKDTAEEDTEVEVTTQYGIAFGIDYTNPDKYLVQGKQSKISNPQQLDILCSEQKDLNHLGNIFRWLKNEFTEYSAGGKTIGKITVDELLESRRLGGCHDHGLVYAAVAREFKYPAVMVRTSSIVWLKRFKANEEEAKLHIGHVFVEVWLDNKWILIDSTNGWYLEENYDPANPVIPLKGKIAGQDEEIYGFYVECKGLDTWDLGIHNQEESTESMDELARQLDLENIVYPEYKFGRFSK